MTSELLPKGPSFKANLHCHSTVSDGKLSPAEVKATYQALGYQIVAYTDHEILVPHKDLSDENFLALHGVEVTFETAIEGVPWPEWPSTHISLIAKDPAIVSHPLFNPVHAAGFFKERHPEIFAEACRTSPVPSLNLNNPQSITDACARAREAGFLPILNHPAWSLLPAAEAAQYGGLYGVEVYNRCAHEDGSIDTDVFYQRLLSLRHLRHALPEPLPCAVAAEDNHPAPPMRTSPGTPRHGWIEIISERLDYPSIIAAMEARHCYASTGAKIYSLRLDSQARTLTVECSPAERIRYFLPGRFNRRAEAPIGETITGATFQLPEEAAGFFRVRIDAPDGTHAWSNAYPVP